MQLCSFSKYVLSIHSLHGTRQQGYNEGPELKTQSPMRILRESRELPCLFRRADAVTVKQEKLKTIYFSKERKANNVIQMYT